MSWYESTRENAHLILHKKGGLSFADVQKLICVEHNAQTLNISPEQAIKFRVSLEIECAKRILGDRNRGMEEGFGHLFSVMFDTFEYYQDKPFSHDNPLTDLPNALLALFEYGYDDRFKELAIDEEAEAEGSVPLLSNRVFALALAGNAIFSSMEELKQRCDPDQYYKTDFMPDMLGKDTIVFALQVEGGLLGYQHSQAQKKANIIFWSWFLNEAIPKAISSINPQSADFFTN